MGKNLSTHLKHIHFQKNVQGYCLFYRGKDGEGYYGCYSNLDDAVYDRNIFVLCGWNWSNFLNYTPDYSKNPLDIPHFSEWSELFLYPIKNINYFDMPTYGMVFYVVGYKVFSGGAINGFNMGRFIYLENAMKYRDVCVEYGFDSHLILENKLVRISFFD